MNSSHESVLVTGGGGFIGTWVLRELLLRGLRPVVLDVQPNTERWQRVLGDDAKNIVFVAGSLLDRDLLRRMSAEHRFSRVIHLSALLTPDCQRDPFAGCQVNVLGSVALFELVRELAGIKGISYASSFAVYGPEIDDNEFTASIDDRPATFYGVFKLAVDLIAEQYWRHFGIASVGIRPHVVYGPERTQGLTAGPSLAIRAAVAGQPYTISYTGNVGYDYVEDVARAFVDTALATPPGSTVVDLPGQVATTEQFVQAIDQVVPGAAARLTVNGSAIPSNVPPQPNYISSLLPDWRATTLVEGIQKTVAFYQRP